MFKRIVLFIVLVLVLFISFYCFNEIESSFFREELKYNVIFISNEDGLKDVEIGDPENIIILKKDKEKLLSFIGGNFLNYKIKEVDKIYFPEKKDLFLSILNLSDYDFHNVKIRNDVKNLFDKKSEEINGNILFSNEEDFSRTEKTFLFVGDMMFDRGVESLSMMNNNFNYPFEKINAFFKNIDFIIGNLEGPIVENPVYVSDRSMNFSFNKKIAEVLKDNNFNLVSLANNHTMNMKKQGLEETREFLTSNSIDFAGHPFTCSIIDIYSNDNFVLYAVNTTYPFNCSDEEIVDNIETIPEDKFLIVMPHWGQEYSHIPSSRQVELAHKMIDAGADLIIGGHPHVIQSIEKYNNKIIFYSLGNFIFDQYFSQETQQGLLVGLQKYEDKLTYNLFLTESKLSQPELKEGSDLFEWLASISSENIRQEIINKRIIIYSKD